MDSYELVLLVKPEVFVYRVPPLTGDKGYKASDWNLSTPDWIGRLRLISIDSRLEIRLEDRTTGHLYAKSPISNFNSPDFESVADSSRYFVIRLRKDSGQSAFVGIGFSDRSDSFDLNVAIQDHFKSLKTSEDILNGKELNEKKLDLSFKDGETITVNIGNKPSNSSSQIKNRSSVNVGGAIPSLPPPPPSGSNRVRKMNA